MELSLRVVLTLLAVILAGLCNVVSAQQVKYCASLNTGSNYESVSDTYQSNGACEQTCGNKYAFAIVQGNSCWCSDAAPGDTRPQGDCDQNCPGYPDDKCGSTSEELYGYIQLFKKPSTTIGGSSSTKSQSASTEATAAASASESASASASESSVEKTTSSSTTVGSSTTLTSSAVPTSTSRSETTQPPSSSKNPDISIQTSDGSMVTVTVAPSSTSSSDSDSDSEESASIGGGAVAGIVVGSLAGVGAIAGVLVWWFCFHRGRRQSKDDELNSSFYERPVPRPTFQGTLGSRDAALAAAAADNGTNGYGSGPTRRVSVPAFTDSRLKPESDIYPNGGRHSNVSLQDHQDYSRPVLRLTNPDPPDA